MSGPAPELGIQHRPIIGRAGELERFRATFARMLAGRRQLVLISGEAGIGKTRCAEALADIAEDQGALVLWGRCREEAGAPPYWPWVQILRSYVDASTLDEVRLNMGTAAQDIAAFVPELLDTSQPPSLTVGAVADMSSARFRTFDALRQFFHQATQQVPITLILDNLHWADAPSLSLLEFLSQESQSSRLLIVGTYRSVDAPGRTPLSNTLGGLIRDVEVERFHLTGLSQTAIGEVAERVCGARLPQGAIDLIYQRTDGNPLYAIELIKVLLDDSAGGAIAATPARIPAGVHETIGRRLSRLSDRCNELLCVAAVHGRQFATREVAAAMDEDVQQALSAFEPAMLAGIVQPVADAPGSYQFTHALIRETIYADVPAVKLLELHRRAGDSLANMHSSHLEPVLSRIAHHYHQAAALGKTDKAIFFALRAAESAIRVFAYEEALLHYDRAIDLLRQSGPAHDDRLARAYILKGSALYQLGRPQGSIEALLEAVNRTSALGSAELLVDALVHLAISTRHVEQQHFGPLVDRALALLPASDSAARAKALAARAFAHRTATDGLQLQALVDDALGMAARCCDATARCACFILTIMALRGDPRYLQRRVLLGAEYIATARAAGSADLLADAYHWQALNLFESGQLDELEGLLHHYDGLGVARFGLHQYQSGTHRVTLALLRGDWEGLEDRIEGLLEIGTRTRREDAAGVYGAQMFALNRDRGRLHALAPQIREITRAATTRMWEPGLMLICAEIGLSTEARAILDRLVERQCQCVSRDDMYATCLVFCAETCCALGDSRHAESLYRLLQPYAGQTANHPTAVCFGMTDLYLAMLACTAKWAQLAGEHFDRALGLSRAMRAWPSLARTLFRHGAFLVARASDAERQRGVQQLREAELLAGRLGMTRLAIEVGALLDAAHRDAAYPDDLTAREVEVLRLLAIGRTNKDVSRVLSISLNTVATHVRSILNKTQCANRTEAATYAIRHGLQAVPSDLIAT